MIEKTSYAVLASVAVGVALCHCSSARDSFGDTPTGFGDGGPEAAIEAGPACAATSLGAEHRPLDLFIMLDKSGSMAGAPWQQAKNALDYFFSNPAGANTAAALNYFPWINDVQDCSSQTYRIFSVELGPLPQHAPALAASLEATTPFGGTPLWHAIDGALYAAVQQKKAQPQHAVSMVIVTDGEPTECDEFYSPANLGETAALKYVAAALLEEGVSTFAIGIGAAPGAVLDAVAAAGGTGKSLPVLDPSHLAEALGKAQDAAIGCEFLIPKKAPSGQLIDPTLVNVTFAAGTNAPHTVPAFSSAAACGTAEGWYLDDPKNPATVRLCPASCSLLEATKNPKVDLNFGCATTVR